MIKDWSHMPHIYYTSYKYSTYKYNGRLRYDSSIKSGVVQYKENQTAPSPVPLHAMLHTWWTMLIATTEPAFNDSSFDRVKQCVA